MRKALVVALAIVMCGFYAVAQDYPKAEVFGGFSLVHIDTEGFTNAKLVALTDTPGSTVKTWYPGWEIAGQYNFTKLLGIKADISGDYGTPVSVPGVTGIPSSHGYTFLFGPVVSFRTGKLTPYFHGLFGANRLSIGSSTLDRAVGPFVLIPGGYTETAFAMAFGGGLDWKLTHHFSARLGQFDYLYTGHCFSVSATEAAELDVAQGCKLGVGTAPAAHQNNFRFSTGIVIH